MLVHGHHSRALAATVHDLSSMSGGALQLYKQLSKTDHTVEGSFGQNLHWPLVSLPPSEPLRAKIPSQTGIMAS